MSRNNQYNRLFNRTAISHSTRNKRIVTRFETLNRAMLTLTTMSIQVSYRAITRLGTNSLKAGNDRSTEILVTRRSQQGNDDQTKATNVRIVVNTTRTNMDNISRCFIKLGFEDKRILSFRFLSTNRRRDLRSESFLQ